MTRWIRLIQGTAPPRCRGRSTECADPRRTGVLRRAPSRKIPGCFDGADARVPGEGGERSAIAGHVAHRRDTAAKRDHEATLRALAGVLPVGIRRDVYMRIDGAREHEASGQREYRRTGRQRARSDREDRRDPLALDEPGRVWPWRRRHLVNDRHIHERDRRRLQRMSGSRDGGSVEQTGEGPHHEQREQPSRVQGTGIIEGHASATGGCPDATAEPRRSVAFSAWSGHARVGPRAGPSTREENAHGQYIGL